MTRPSLGVNFEPHDLDEPAGYARAPLVALRPAVVRQIVTARMDLPAWIYAASVARVRVIWCVAPERLGLIEARRAMRLLAEIGAGVTEALEIGYAPWRHAPGYAAHRFAAEAVLLAAEAFARAPRTRRILGLGLDGSTAAFAWLHAFLRAPNMHAQTVGVVVPIVALHDRFRGWPWPNSTRRVAALLASAFGGGITFTRVECSTTVPLPHLAVGLEHVARYLEDRRELAPVAGEGLTPHMRRRWLVEAYRTAAAAAAPDFILDVEASSAPGVGRWGMYHAAIERPDPAWYALQWAPDRHAAEDAARSHSR